MNVYFWLIFFLCCSLLSLFLLVYAPWAVTIFFNILQISMIIIIVSCEAFLAAIYTGMNSPAKNYIISDLRVLMTCWGVLLQGVSL